MTNLSDIKKENNFKVPDGYFDNFYDNLQEKIKTEEKPKQKVFYLNFMMKVAAVLLVGLLLFSPVNNNNTFHESTESIELSDNDMLDFYASTLSEYEMFLLLTDSY